MLYIEYEPTCLTGELDFHCQTHPKIERIIKINSSKWSMGNMSLREFKVCSVRAWVSQPRPLDILPTQNKHSTNGANVTRGEKRRHHDQSSACPLQGAGTPTRPYLPAKVPTSTNDLKRFPYNNDTITAAASTITNTNSTATTTSIITTIITSTYTTIITPTNTTTETNTNTT
ncbi:unnamed protein product [Nesidiocoris tenuis]|uniref:Uncharacterized protein n=1 Tax=Nesidiocoris tenuis TaxID=355587 RepID=A0A6H5H3M2_9HEMI|nr:unnamed protein product [Nesidiocoris tenuis]